MGILDFTIKRALPAAAATSMTAWAGITTANDDWDDYFHSSSSSSASANHGQEEKIVILGSGWAALNALRKCAIDAKKTGNDWEIFTHGGRNPTGLNAISWAKEMVRRGAGELLITSMDKDGTKSGFDNELNAAISSEVDVPIIASGGVGNLDHLVDGIIEGKADAVLAASIFHFGEYTITEAKNYMRHKKIEVR